MSYIQFLCHEGYNSSSVSSLLRQRVNCSTLIPANGEDAINYPTMQLGIKSDQEPTIGIFRRRVTNVGQAMSVYNATIRAPKGVDIWFTHLEKLPAHCKKSINSLYQSKVFD
ncbi:hypothetical protein HAX54_033831 [Datura stramonium]|uniref:Subtilisin-like protease fibronectin type-III domain-containing protein n=1 Tax=Datura stramonium TaxID=4076 RepID=A0ABS8VFR3_DATST|nr:hypothetical protein [Datura stramonium]